MLGRVPVRVIGEFKDMRKIIILAGPDFGHETTVNVNRLKEVNPNDTSHRQT